MAAAASTTTAADRDMPNYHQRHIIPVTTLPASLTFDADMRDHAWETACELHSSHVSDKVDNYAEYYYGVEPRISALTDERFWDTIDDDELNWLSIALLERLARESAASRTTIIATLPSSILDTLREKTKGFADVLNQLDKE